MKTTENTKQIDMDAVMAKKTGVTYGQFKAGILPDDEDSGYEVSRMDYLKRTENTSLKKTVAFIKIAR